MSSSQRVVLLLAIAMIALTTMAGPVLAAEPSTGPGTGGDPRSSGQGPGLVGDPLFAIGVVVAVAALSILLTIVYVRLTDPGGRARRS